MTTTPRRPTRATEPSISISSRLAELGWELPQAATPIYTYEPVALWNDLAFVSGQISRRDGVVLAGVLGVDRTPEEAHDAAALCALNALAQLDAAVGLDRVARILKLTVYIASGGDVVSQPSAAEGASTVFVAAFGDAGRHARLAIGVPRLPADALAELDLVVALHPE